MAFAVYLDRVLPGVGSARPILEEGLGPLSRITSPRTLVALATVAGLTLVHVRGLERGRRLQNVLGAASAIAIVIMVVAGAVATPAVVPPPLPASAGPVAAHPVVALVLVMFTYSGWNAATYVAGEIRRPAVSIRRGLLAGTLIVLVLYVGLNLVYLHALSFPGLQAVTVAADAAGAALFGARAAEVVSLVVMVALLAGMSAMIMTGPRIYFAMARDGALPDFFARTDPDAGVPTAAILVQSAWCVVLILTGTFESILEYTGFAVVLFATAAVASLFVLRCRAHGPRPGRVWGYPVAPGLFVVMGLIMTIQSIRYAPAPSLVGLGVTAAGIPVYLRSRRGASS